MAEASPAGQVPLCCGPRQGRLYQSPQWWWGWGDTALPCAPWTPGVRLSTGCRRVVGALVGLDFEREMQQRGRRWREESRGPGGHGGKERRGGWAILPSPAKHALSGFGRKGIEYIGRLSFLSFPHFHVFFLLSVFHPSPQGRSCFCPSDQMFLNSSHQTTSEERLSAAGKETSFRNWINILLFFFFFSLSDLSPWASCRLCPSAFSCFPKVRFKLLFCISVFCLRCFPVSGWSSSIPGTRAESVPLQEIYW